MAIGKVELMQGCCPKHLRMGAARMKENKDKEFKKRRVNLERTAGPKKTSPDCITIVRAYRPTGSLLPEAVDELPN